MREEMKEVIWVSVFFLLFLILKRKCVHKLTCSCICLTDYLILLQ